MLPSRFLFILAAPFILLHYLRHLRRFEFDIDIDTLITIYCCHYCIIYCHFPPPPFADTPPFSLSPLLIDITRFSSFFFPLHTCHY